MSAKFLKLEQLDHDQYLPTEAMGVSMDGTGQVGTYFYTAPEVEQKWPQINEKVRTNYLDFYLTNDKKKLCEMLLISPTAYVLVFIFPLSLQTVYSLILKMNAILLFSKWMQSSSFILEMNAELLPMV